MGDDDRPGAQRSGRTTGSSVLTPPTGIPLVAGVSPPVDPPRPAEAAPATSVPEQVAAWDPVVSPAAVVAPAGSCQCGHDARAHAHWRPGSDCGACGAGGCASFRRCGGRLRRMLRRLRSTR